MVAGFDDSALHAVRRPRHSFGNDHSGAEAERISGEVYAEGVG